MYNTIYYLIIVIYYFWYFYVKNVILDLGDLFPCFQVHLMPFKSNLIHDMVRYQLGVILEYIFLYVKFYGALKQAPKSVNVFKKLLNKKIRKCESLLFFWFFKNYELIRDYSLWRSNFIPLVRDSIIITRSRCYTYTFSSRFDYNHWVRVSIKNLNFSFLEQVFQYCLLDLKVCRLRFAS